MVSIPEEELERLKDKNRHQARQITLLQESLRARNLDLDAMHFVWCDGGCPGGVHRFHTDLVLTEDMVERAERNAKRLRKWYGTVKWRLAQPNFTEWLKAYSKRAAEKTDLVV